MKKDGNKPRFELFGDNAYLNSSFMATPYTNVSGDPQKKTKYNYKFYHSQICIQVQFPSVCLFKDGVFFKQLFLEIYQ